MKDVVIVGGGIAGLSAGFELSKAGIDFHILESTDRCGGLIKSIQNGDYLFESGPYIFSSSSKGVMETIKDLEIEEELLEANPEARKRYVYTDGKLISLPRKLSEFLKTDILSKNGKMTILEEFFIPPMGHDESVEQFFLRKFGREVLKNIIQPFLAGVYAGDVKKLSCQAIFPLLKELESKYKSVLLGLILSGKFKSMFSKTKFYSFEKGMETLPKTLYEKVKSHVTFGTSDIQVNRAKDFFIVNFKVGGKQVNYTTNSVIFALPAYKIKDYPHLFPSRYTMELFDIEYYPMAVVSQAIDKSKINMNLDGYGFLCAQEPRRKLLGTMWTSSIFPNRAPSGKVLLSLYIGGSYHKKVAELSEEEIRSQVAKEVSEIMQISDSNVFEDLCTFVHKKAIPQYYLGHLEKVKRVEDMMDKNFGLFFTGNYLYGISINDTIETTKKVVAKVKSFLSTVRTQSTKEPEKELVNK
ncbi:MAG: protoporphyrinogen oxidase [Candidatus Melainabacteria bacterium]|nr:protoporphyrinogen oxidase [Candidatus Melainabacteria bacterium]